MVIKRCSGGNILLPWSYNMNTLLQQIRTLEDSDIEGYEVEVENEKEAFEANENSYLRFPIRIIIYIILLCVCVMMPLVGLYTRFILLYVAVTYRYA